LTAHRFRYPVAARLVVGEVVALAEDDAFHLVRVVRARLGEAVELLDGDGRVFAATVESLSPLRLVVDSELPDRPPPPLPVVLVQSILGGTRFEDVVTAASELDLAAVVPAWSAGCAYRPDGAAWAKKRRRWERVATAAARQSKRLAPIEIRTPIDLMEAVRSRALDPTATVCCTNQMPARPLAAVLGEMRAAERAVIVGPEGGFGDEEIEAIWKAGIPLASLGPTVLRAETAAVAACAVAVQSVLGRA
jgi:16S rRNA (uracil1498-N3)-methyltransferase